VKATVSHVGPAGAGYGTLRRASPAAQQPMKIVVILFLIAILASLGSALFFLVKDRGQSDRTLKALALRIGLSLALFLLLMASYYFGFIPGKLT
jgi:hypothetical protein